MGIYLNRFLRNLPVVIFCVVTLFCLASGYVIVKMEAIRYYETFIIPYSVILLDTQFDIFSASRSLKRIRRELGSIQMAPGSFNWRIFMSAINTLNVINIQFLQKSGILLIR